MLFSNEYGKPVAGGTEGISNGSLYYLQQPAYHADAGSLASPSSVLGKLWWHMQCSPLGQIVFPMAPYLMNHFGCRWDRNCWQVVEIRAEQPKGGTRYMYERLNNRY